MIKTRSGPKLGHIEYGLSITKLGLPAAINNNFKHDNNKCHLVIIVEKQIRKPKN